MTLFAPLAPIAVALDGPDLQTVTGWAKAVDGIAAVVKVGLESYLRDGAAGVRQIQDAAPQASLFLDLKLHDIPATVAGACRSVAGLNPAILKIGRAHV